MIYLPTKRPDYFLKFTGNDGEVLSTNPIGRKIKWKNKVFLSFPDSFIDNVFIAPFNGIFLFNVHVYQTSTAATSIRRSEYETNFTDFNGEDHKAGTDFLMMEKGQSFYFYSNNNITLKDDPLKHYLFIIGYKNLDD